MSAAIRDRQQVAVRITARSPLAFAERKPGVQFRESLPYVPGTALFGALGRHLAETGAFDEDFLRRIRCHNAYPMQDGDAWVRPLSLTALQPKGQSKAPVVDALVARVCWERQCPPALIYLPTDDDGRAWELPSWRFYTLTPWGPQERQVAQRVLSRVAINRRRGTAEDQRLYSPLVLSEANYDPRTDTIEASRFLGSFSVDAADAARLAGLLPHLRYVGGRQSTGLGAVTVEPWLPERVPEEPPLIERVERLTSRFQRQAAFYCELGGNAWDIQPRTIFTVNLLADAILYREGWLPTQELSAAMIEELTGIKVTLLRAFTRNLTIGGWATLWQRPKATSLAVGMGSLYLFQAEEPLTAAACSELERLQLEGIGERRQEGFGQVRIIDTFHLIDQFDR